MTRTRVLVAPAVLLSLTLLAAGCVSTSPAASSTSEAPTAVEAEPSESPAVEEPPEEPAEVSADCAAMAPGGVPQAFTLTEVAVTDAPPSPATITSVGPAECAFFLDTHGASGNTIDLYWSYPEGSDWDSLLLGLHAEFTAQGFELPGGGDFPVGFYSARYERASDGAIISSEAGGDSNPYLRVTYHVP